MVLYLPRRHISRVLEDDFVIKAVESILPLATIGLNVDCRSRCLQLQLAKVSLQLSPAYPIARVTAVIPRWIIFPVT
jgi:hypothetical protein